MAMFVSSLTKKTESLHVGSEITTNPHFVTEVQADGHELIACFDLLGIKGAERPMANGKPLRVVKFYGDQAKFIVGNWKK